MKKLLLLFTILATVIAKAQTLKTATDDYYDGKIAYQYYEDPKTSEYVKHGTFKYVKSLKSNFGSYLQVVTGQFKNGYRDGAWNFSITRTDFPNNGGSYTTGKTTSIQTFKEGMPNGIWQINSFWKARNRVFNVWKPFEQTYTENASTTFINGHASGITTYNNPKPTTITLNKDGFLIGNYVFPGPYRNTEMSFNSKGVVTKFIEREKNGKVFEKIDFDTELIGIAGKYLSGEVSDEDLFDQNIKVDTVNARNYIEFGSAFEDDTFIMPGLGGDKTYDGSSSNSKRIYGRYILAQRIHVVPYHQHKEWPGTIGDIETRISCYQHFLDYYSIEISKEDREAINSSIEQLTQQIENNVQKEALKSKYEAVEELIKKNLYTESSANLFGFGEVVIRINEMLTPDLKKLDSLKSYIEAEFPKYKSITGTVENIDYEKRLIIANKYLEITEKEYLPLYTRINNNRAIAARTENAITRAEQAFQKVYYGEEILGFPAPEKTISGMYKIYKNLLGKELDKIKATSTLSPQIKEDLDKIVLLANKARQLIGTDNTELIKNIKKAKNLDESFLIFTK